MYTSSIMTHTGEEEREYQGILMRKEPIFPYLKLTGRPIFSITSGLMDRLVILNSPVISHTIYREFRW
jgi:hypothetical protein